MNWTENNRKTIYRLKESELDISIHKVHGLEGWYLTCHKLQIDTLPLKTEDFNEAVERSQIIIIEKADSIYKAACKFVAKPYDDNQFSRY